MVLESVPVGFALSVECHCSCFSSFFFFSSLSILDCTALQKFLDAENKALAEHNSCCNFCIAPDLDLFRTL